MKIEFHLSNRHLLFVVIIIAILEGVALAIAYGGTQPAVMGHSSGEVMINIGGGDKSLQQAINDGDFTPAAPIAEFGGMYVKCCPSVNTCVSANPVTGGCSCPAGYSPIRSGVHILYWPNVGASPCGPGPCMGTGQEFYCYR